MKPASWLNAAFAAAAAFAADRAEPTLKMGYSRATWGVGAVGMANAVPGRRRL